MEQPVISLWTQLINDYSDLLPALLLSFMGSITKLLTKGCHLTLSEALRDCMIGAFACLMTYFFLYDKVGQALMFFFSCASGFLSYEFLSLLSKTALDMLKRLADMIKKSDSK